MKIAVVGGGQLGMMLGEAGHELGIETRFLDPSTSASANRVGELTIGSISDPAAIALIAAGCDAVTYEWEGVPAEALIVGAANSTVAPPVSALSVSQDRLLEKNLCGELGIECAPFAAVNTEADLREAVAALGLPAILKTRRGGYDGKGQFRIGSVSEIEAAWDELGPAKELILEGLVDFDRELSVIACRGRDAKTVVWPVAQNCHEGGILRESRVPSVDTDTQHTAASIIGLVLDRFDYVGVLCVELFDCNGTLLVNEFAPRVHNSGHWTIEGATTSQFSNHMRAVAGLPLGDPSLSVGGAAMLNCIGQMPDVSELRKIPGTFIHDYGKTARTSRKVGHVTIVAPDFATLDSRVDAAKALISNDG